MIIIPEISRLGRNVFQVFKLLQIVNEKKCYIYAIDENLIYNVDRKMDTKFYGCVIKSIEESDKLSNRIINSQNYIRANGGYIGRAPYGKKLIKNENGVNSIVVNEEENNIIKTIIAKYNSSVIKIRNQIIAKYNILKSRIPPLNNSYSSYQYNNNNNNNSHNQTYLEKKCNKELQYVKTKALSETALHIANILIKTNNKPLKKQFIKKIIEKHTNNTMLQTKQ